MLKGYTIHVVLVNGKTTTTKIPLLNQCENPNMVRIYKFLPQWYGGKMVTVKTKEELEALVQQGFKPYYHKGVRRWYLRKGQTRHIIGRGLESEAKALAEKLEVAKRKNSDYKVAQAIKMRLEGIPVSAIVEKTGIPRSSLYEKFEKHDSGKLQLQPQQGAMQTEFHRNSSSQEAVTPTSGFTKGTCQSYSILDEVSKSIEESVSRLQAFLNDFRRISEKVLSQPEVVKDLADLAVFAIGSMLLPIYRKMNIDATPVIRILREIEAEHKNVNE